MFKIRRLPAFTLLEFLLVLVVIGLLAGLVIAKIDEAKEQSYIATLHSDLRSYAQAQELYHSKQGAYADDPASLPTYALSRDVFVVQSYASNTAWALRLGHSGTDVTCVLEVGSLPSHEAENRIRCGPSTFDIDFVVSNQNPAPGEEVTFDATAALAQLAAHTADGFIPTLFARDIAGVDRISWEFGDGVNVSGEPLAHVIETHKYMLPGDYLVTLTIAKADGGIAQASKIISVVGPINEPPAASFTFTPEEPKRTDIITFTATATDPDGDSLTYSWNFGDGEFADEPVVQKSYAAAGEYVVELTVTDGKGGESTHVDTVVVTGGAIFSKISTGGFTACGLTPEGKAYCWGNNSMGLLGNGTTGSSLVPTPVLTHLTFRDISVAADRACAITFSDQSYCWGANYSGQLGVGTQTNPIRSPTPVTGGLSFQQISAGAWHICGITAAGVGYCWGDDLWGQLGSGFINPSGRTTPGPITGSFTFRQVVTGYDFTCGLTSQGQAYCWGFNSDGQLGDGTTISHPDITPVVGGLIFSQIATKRFHACGLTDSGQAYCWGSNGSGQLGDGTKTNRPSPVLVTGDLTFAQISLGDDHTCALTTAGDAYCWGGNSYGALGDGTTTQRLVPTPVAGGLRFTQISSGGRYTCGITVEQETYCWGDNLNGSLGDGTKVNRTTPTPVTPIAGS